MRNSTTSPLPAAARTGSSGALACDIRVSSKAPAYRRQPSGRAVREHREGDVILDKYRLVRVLGEGGMGSVWLARNLTLEVDVAVKLIRGDLTQSDAAWRLLQEARAAARLGHPSIVRVFDFGITPKSQPFIVMELLQGESLREVLDRKDHLDPIRAVRTLLPVASALAAAHDKGIIHRDFKPDNIVLARDETGVIVPKIVDFGLAKLHSRDGMSLAFTQKGMVLGSPGYMSPEQGSGYIDVDQRTDVWAFSVVLYEVLTGAYPFNGRDYNALLAAILMNEPMPIKAYGVNESALWDILAKGLTKNPRERWQNMRELGTALAEWLTTQGAETDVAGNSLAAHWTKVHEHRPISGILTAPTLRSALPPKAGAASGMRLSQVPTPPMRAPGAGLSGGEPGATARIRVWVAAGRSRAAAQILAAAAVTGFVLFLGNRIGANLPPSRAASPPPRAAASSRAAAMRPPVEREARIVSLKQSIKPRPAASTSKDPPAARAAPSASAVMPIGSPRNP